jgi:predicted MPP superfamily phosphohydrolase
MSLFLITFFLIYGCMHFYAYLKVRSALVPGIAATLCIIFFMLVMTLAPLIIQKSEQYGFDLFARIMSYVGYSWMGILLIFFVCSLVIDTFRLVLYAGEFIVQGNFNYLKPTPRLAFFTALILSLSVSIYGSFEARDIVTEKVSITTSKLPEEVERLKIVQISDVHIGLIVREDRVNRIIKEVRRVHPDMLISTGDLVDGQIDNLASLSDILQEINPPYGKFAITGNHEFYAGLEQALDFTRKSGFTLLRGEGRTVNDVINIVGVDDPAGKRYGLFKDVSEKELLSKFHNGKFTLLLKHRPLIDKKSLGLYDLQLSGRTHKGQIFPFSVFTKLRYMNHAGYLKLMENTHLYVSRGSGTWGPPVRFLSPPEVTVIEIINNNTLKIDN